MNNELMKLIREEIDRRKESDLEISKKVRELQKIYNLLVAKRRK